MITDATMYDTPTTFAADEMGASADFSRACAKVASEWDFEELLEEHAAA